MPMRRASCSQAATSARPTPLACTPGATARPRTSAMSPHRMCRAPLPAKRLPSSVSTSATKKSRRFSKMFCMGRTSMRPRLAQ